MTVSGIRLPRGGIRVAVVQNESELAHYSYGDSSEAFLELGCTTTSYTAYNISQFVSRLADGDIDVAVLGPNALNIAATREALLTGAGRDVLSDFLLGGGGLLILHQGGLAGQGGVASNNKSPGSRFQVEQLDFLPERLRGIRARLRPIAEEPWQGSIGEWQGGREQGGRHIVMAAPNRLEPAEITRAAAMNTDVRALYWHYWADLDISWWQPLLCDVDTSEERCVMAASRESDNWRIVVASMPFDWHKNLTVLSNVVSYLADGRPSTVFLRGPDGPSTAARLAWVGGRAVGLVFREFVVGRDDEQMIEEARNNTFDTVVVAHLSSVPSRLREVLERRSSAWQLEVLSLPQTNADAILVKGQHFRIQALVQEFVVQAAAMCASGFVDGSFWATVDALRSIDKIDASLLDDRFPGKALEVASRSEQPDGSYNGVFAATVGLAWLKWRFNDPSFSKTLDWVQKRVGGASARDRFYLWTIMAEIGLLMPADLEMAAARVDELRAVSRRQADIVVAAECARLIDPSGEMTAACLEYLGETLVQRQTNVWLDLGLAGDVMRLASPIACEVAGAPESLMACLELALSSLLRWLHPSDSGLALAVDTNASMRVRGKALAGLTRFSEVSPLPLWSLLELLERSSRNAGQRLQRAARSDLVDYLRQEYAALSDAHAKTNGELTAVRRRESARKRRRLPLAVTTILVAYALATVAVAGVVKRTGGSLSVLHAAFIGAYAIHLGVVGTVVTVAGVIVAYRQLIESRRGTGHSASGK